MWVGCSTLTRMSEDNLHQAIGLWTPFPLCLHEGRRTAGLLLPGPWLLRRNKQESPHLDANLRFLKPNSYSPWEVQVTTMLADLSMSRLQALKNLFGCQNHGIHPPTATSESACFAKGNKEMARGRLPAPSRSTYGRDRPVFPPMCQAGKTTDSALNLALTSGICQGEAMGLTSFGKKVTCG